MRSMLRNRPQVYLAAVATLLGACCWAKVMQRQGGLVKFEDHHHASNKPDKFDTSPVMNHPYQYEDSYAAANSMIDTAPYAPSVNPSYTPPILQQETSENSKLDHLGHFGGGDHYHMKGLLFGDAAVEHQNPPWKKLLRIATAAIPIGLFLAALPPNVVYVNTAQPVPKPLGTSSQRQRSDTSEHVTPVTTFPVLDMIERAGGLPALEKPECEAFIFCSMARLGAHQEANSVQRFLYSTAHGIPDTLAEMFGIKEIMKAIRTDSCSIYKCSLTAPQH
ncbi:hypothetical protein B566_EDAN011926 [Ephemera danica]|nr:hypothetical protein B566_EDAN011926 [Ephemera danica]